MIVADTNLASYLLIDGVHTASARRVWRRDPEWRLPPLWRSEFLNVLALSVRSKVLSEPQAFQAWRVGSSLFARAETEPGGEAVLAAALGYGLSAYDAHFVVLAEHLDVPLVTGDRHIVRACPKVATSIEAFGRH